MPQTLLITGASSGIGAALAEAYASPGITLYILGRNAARLEAVANECRVRGAQVQLGIIDVTDKNAMAEFITRMDDATPIDLVIANAGISSGFVGEDNSGNTSQLCHSREGGNPLSNEGDSRLCGNDNNQSMCMDSSRTIDAVFATNVQGVLNTIQPLIPRMVARGRGQIAIMSSLASLRALPSAPAYSASKAAVRYYGEALRPLLAKRGVQVSVICPGWITTPLTAINTFSMPFEMSALRAAHVIKRGITLKKSRIAFPRSVYFPLAILAILPNFMTDFIFARLPSKPHKS